MDVAALFSGGKDSTFTIFLAQKLGHTVKCLLTIIPSSDESHLLHHVNASWTKLQAKSMNIPQLTITVNKKNNESEILAIEKILQQAKSDFNIKGLIHGGIASNFQKDQFENICKKQNLQSLAPIWNTQAENYLHDLIANGFDYIITSVSSDGLDDFWLGKKITKDDIAKLTSLSKKYGFNLNFEGGEAETFVINCPLFSKPIRIHKSKKIWDGYRGRFEIVDAGVNNNA